MNKYEKAWKNMTFFHSEKAHKQDSHILIKELVERATPKKVTHIDEDLHMFVCPNRDCRSTIQCTDDYDHKYCLECGQVLDWNE